MNINSMYFNTLDLGKALAQLASMIDFLPNSTKTVDIRLSLYAILRNYSISTYDGTLIKAFKNIGRKESIVYQHYLFDHFNFEN